MLGDKPSNEGLFERVKAQSLELSFWFKNFDCFLLAVWLHVMKPRLGYLLNMDNEYI